MNKTLLAIFLSSQLISPAVVSAETENDLQKNNAAGFGIGALIGGLFAGPPGVVVGAAAGSFFGAKENEKIQTITSLEKQLDDKNTELNMIINEFAILESQHKNRLQNVRLEKKQKSLEQLSEGISLSVYFRTDQSDLETQFVQSIQRLAKLIENIPEIKVQLDAYADQRGDMDYNQKLSQKRASSVLKQLVRAGLNNNRIHFHAYGETQTKTKPGDKDAYSFDRRVDLTLSLHNEA